MRSTPLTVRRAAGARLGSIVRAERGLLRYLGYRGCMGLIRKGKKSGRIWSTIPVTFPIPRFDRLRLSLNDVPTFLRLLFFRTIVKFIDSHASLHLPAAFDSYRVFVGDGKEWWRS
ncbi:hypothetical protein EI94DRAFT_1739606 [Lactarius quietus]|nr:hypothetical protein EI94DRAFT_1739606 [Lactarius quietus]